MQLPQVDPKFTFWFGVWTQILLLLTGIGVDHAPALIAQYAPDVQWVCGVFYKVNNLVLTALIGISSTQAGPLISIPANAMKPLILVAAVLAGLFGFSGRADAATKAPAAPVAAAAPSKCALVFDPLKLCGVLTGNIQTDVQRVAKRLAAVSKADLNYTMLKAKAAGTPASKVRLQCVQSISDAVDQVNGAGLKNPDGTVMARPNPALVTMIEDVAELVDNLSPQGTLLTSCAGAAQMLGMNALQAVNAIITGTATFAALPVGL